MHQNQRAWPRSRAAAAMPPSVRKATPNPSRFLRSFGPMLAMQMCSESTVSPAPLLILPVCASGRGSAVEDSIVGRGRRLLAAPRGGRKPPKTAEGGRILAFLLDFPGLGEQSRIIGSWASSEAAGWALSMRPRISGSGARLR